MYSWWFFLILASTCEIISIAILEHWSLALSRYVSVSMKYDSGCDLAFSALETVDMAVAEVLHHVVYDLFKRLYALCKLNVVVV